MTEREKLLTLPANKDGQIIPFYDTEATYYPEDEVVVVAGGLKEGVERVVIAYDPSTESASLSPALTVYEDGGVDIGRFHPPMPTMSTKDRSRRHSGITLSTLDAFVEARLGGETALTLSLPLEGPEGSQGALVRRGDGGAVVGHLPFYVSAGELFSGARTDRVSFGSPQRFAAMVRHAKS